MAIAIHVAAPVSKKIKTLFYGPAGSGKTLAALTFPGVILVDSEHGSDLYAGRAGVQPFQVAHVKTMSDLGDVVTQIEKDAGKTWQTLVIDPISVLYVVEQTTASNNNTKDLTFRDWGRINSRLNALYTRLTNLPLHVVVIAREAIDYDSDGMKRVGVKPQADKNLVYMMDFVLHLNAQHGATVEKSRGTNLAEHGTVSNVSWELFKAVANDVAVGQLLSHESDEEAAQRESDNLKVRENAEEFVKYWRNQGLTDRDLLTALKVSRISEWEHGRAAADEACKAYIQSQSAPPTSKTA